MRGGVPSLSAELAHFEGHFVHEFFQRGRACNAHVVVGHEGEFCRSCVQYFQAAGDHSSRGIPHIERRPPRDLLSAVG